MERVKNQGRQDIKNKWQEIENKWVEIIKKQTGDSTIKWINPNECLSYQKDELSFSVSEEDFIQGMMKYLMYKEEIDEKEFADKLVDDIMYSSTVTMNERTKIVSINIQGGELDE